MGRGERGLRGSRGFSRYPHLRANDKSPLHIITNPFTTNIKLDVVLR